MEAESSPARLRLQRYRDEGGRAGVAGFADLPQGLAVEFGDGRVYLYNYDCPGRFHVEHMKALASQGPRLSTYISRHVGKRYAARLR
ncbi:MAG TPA: hypothetical protein VLM17_03200 [Xanthomonadaceae bacterium]|nr:hypothetical protein [Xanthomonadaceae bacterium]